MLPEPCFVADDEPPFLSGHNGINAPLHKRLCALIETVQHVGEWGLPSISLHCVVPCHLDDGAGEAHARTPG